MKKSRFTEEQITFAMRQAEGGVPSGDDLPEAGHQQTDVLPVETEVCRLMQLEEEKRRTPVATPQPLAPRRLARSLSIPTLQVPSFRNQASGFGHYPLSTIHDQLSGPRPPDPSLQTGRNSAGRRKQTCKGPFTR